MKEGVLFELFEFTEFLSYQILGDIVVRNGNQPNVAIMDHIQTDAIVYKGVTTNTMQYDAL